MRFSSVSVAVVAFIAFASAADEPSHELKAARSRYEASVAAATKPVRDRYILELQQLKSRAISMKNLNSALVIDQEIKSVAENAPLTNDSVRNRLINTTWIWYQSETITFVENGMAKWSHGTNSFTWRVTNPSDRIIEGDTPHGEKYKIKFDAHHKTGLIFDNGNNPPRTTTLVTAK